MPTTHDALIAQIVDALRSVLARVAEPRVVLSTILKQAVDLTGATRGVFVEVLPGGALEFRVLHHYRGDLLDDQGHYSRTVFSACLGRKEDILLADAAADPSFGKSGSVNQFQMASVLCMPIRVSGSIAALVHLESSEPGHFREEHRRLLRPLLDMSASVLEALGAGRKMIEERDRLADSEQALREEAQENREVLARDWSFGRFVGRSEPVRELESRIRKAAGSEFPILLLGETGTGKSILARVIHSLSPRVKRPFVTVFCPSLEKSMVEAELFGHRRGAFTGAVADRLGKVQAAEHGTLFLDEIGDLPPEIQPKLLRLLQEKSYERVGDSEERRADVRVIAATNRDLELEVRAGRFRRDLFERLNYVPVTIPPLRERVEDIPSLLRHCLDGTDAGRWIVVGDAGERYLRELDFAWPGNVRHIEQLAARLSMEERGRPMGPDDLRRLLDLRPEDSDAEPVAAPGAARPVEAAARVGPSRPGSGLDLDVGLPRLLKETERAWLEEALRRYPRVTRAELAAKLKISESALFKKLRAYELGD